MRLRFLIWLGIVGLAISAPAAEQRPNIVVIMADDMSESLSGRLPNLLNIALETAFQWPDQFRRIQLICG